MTNPETRLRVFQAENNIRKVRFRSSFSLLDWCEIKLSPSIPMTFRQAEKDRLQG